MFFEEEDWAFLRSLIVSHDHDIIYAHDISHAHDASPKSVKGHAFLTILTPGIVLLARFKILLIEIMNSSDSSTFHGLSKKKYNAERENHHTDRLYA